MAEFETKDSGARQEFDSGMHRDTEAGKARFDLIVPDGVPYEEQILTRFAMLLSRGAEKYTERNWEQANSDVEIKRAKSSAFRHFMQWLCGERDEDHAAAVMFNLMVVETTQHKIDQEAELEKEFAKLAQIWKVPDPEVRFETVDLAPYIEEVAKDVSRLAGDIEIVWGDSAVLGLERLEETLRAMESYSIPARFVAGVDGTFDLKSLPSIFELSDGPSDKPEGRQERLDIRPTYPNAIHEQIYAPVIAKLEEDGSWIEQALRHQRELDARRALGPDLLRKHPTRWDLG